HDAGLKIGFYYSQNVDWMHEGGMDFIPELNNGTYPADKVEKYVNELVIPHIQELTTKYDIDLFWFDAPGASNTNPTLAQNILDALLQSPIGNKVIYNDRLAPGFEGDFFTPENDTPDIPYNGYDHNKNWEACSSLNSSWGFEYEPDTYNAYNYTWKSGLYSISRILELASKGGNFLLNVGPDRHGVIPEPAVNTLKEIGDYMQLYGETVYGTQKNTLLNPFEYGYVTQKTDADGTFHWYLHVSPAYWNEKSIVVNGITELPENATLLATQELLPVTLENNNLLITLPEMDCPDQYYAPVELVFSQTPQQVSKSNIRNNQIRLTPFQASTKELNKDFIPYTIKYWYGRNAEMRFRIYLEKGTYQLGAEYAAWYQPGELYFTINDASYTGHYQATGLASVPNDFSHYISDDLGGLSITIPKSQVYTLSVKRNAEVPNVTNWIYVRNFTLTKSGSDTGFNSSGVQIYPTVIRVTTDKYLYCKTFEVQTFRIYNSQGHCVKTFIADKQELKIDASNLPAGVYLVVGKRSLHKIIIE
ncbi:MAG: alpha-L-fucosidase, partial [Candidatus Symbiothrix sp.]|nr:alpha-L-fucosidase [Candidatus Symbiothrix sp.]